VVRRDPYGDDAQIDIALALLDSLTIDRAVWVANSAGARVAVAVALRHRERVIALVLVDPAISGGPGWLRPLLRIPQLQHIGPLTVRSISDRGDAVIRRAWHDPTRVTADVLAGYRKPLRANDWDKALWEFTSAPRDSEMLRDVAGSPRHPPCSSPATMTDRADATHDRSRGENSREPPRRAARLWTRFRRRNARRRS
jgi:pimeloyl-ACP methyl ester carboxylesterase